LRLGLAAGFFQRPSSGLAGSGSFCFSISSKVFFSTARVGAIRLA